MNRLTQIFIRLRQAMLPPERGLAREQRQLLRAQDRIVKKYFQTQRRLN